MFFSLVLGTGMALFPESPRFDFRNGRTEIARRTMAKLHGIPENHVHIQQELDELHDQIKKESVQQAWHEFFSAPMMFYRLVLGMILQALQQLTGANYYFYFGTTIFEGAGMSNSFATQCILGAVNFGSTFAGLYIVENFGRRKSLITGAFVMFALFMVFASLGQFVLDYETPQNTPSAGKGMIVVACFFIATYAVTWGPMVSICCCFMFNSVMTNCFIFFFFPTGLGNHGRDLPNEVSCQGNGIGHRVQLAVELFDFFLHQFYHVENPFYVRLRFRWMLLLCHACRLLWCH